MSGPVLPEGLEVHVAEVVLHGDGILLHDVGYACARVRGLGELESRAVYVVPECHDVYALPVLGDTVVLAVEDLVQRGVPHVLERVDDDFESPSLVVDREALDVLAEDDLGLVLVAYPDDIEEEGSAGHPLVIIVEPHLLSGYGERLARETSETYVELGDIFLVDFGYVSVDLRRRVEVRLVGLLCVRIPLAGEHGLNLITECPVEAHADSADACEKVD